VPVVSDREGALSSRGGGAAASGAASGSVKPGFDCCFVPSFLSALFEKHCASIKLVLKLTSLFFQNSFHNPLVII